METEKIDFISKAVTIEEMWGKRKFRLSMEETIMGFEKKMLSSGECRHTILMHFVTEDNYSTVYYDFTGKIQLKDYIKRKSLDCKTSGDSQMLVAVALNVLSGVFECIKGMENYLLFPDRITLDPDAIFLDSKSEQVSIAFYPNVDPDVPIQHRILELITDLKALFGSDETDEYLIRIIDYINCNNPGLDGLINFLGTMQRDVCYIYWSNKSFRQAVEEDVNLDRSKITKSLASRIFNLKAALIQALAGSVLVIVFLTNKLDIVKFAGLAIVVAALDYQILKNLRAVK